MVIKIMSNSKRIKEKVHFYVSILAGAVQSSGERAIGHSGANIGTSVYMVHLPEHHFTVVVMINSFNHECSAAITKDLIANVLKELNVIGIIPYFDFFPLGFVIIGASLTLLVIIFFKLRKLKANKKCGKVHS